LLTIARRAALQVVREEGCPSELPDVVAEGRSPEEEHERSERARATLEAIAALPPREREALVRTSIHGDSGRETALALGVSEDVVRQLVHRARRRARAAL